MSEIEIEWDDDVYLDVYKPIVGDDANIKFFWGGRDGGKTHHIGLELVHKCLTSRYFKCLLIRDTYDSVKDSQYETIRSIVNQYSLEELFHFTVNPLKIQCINGNSFIARGCNDVDRIKSVKDPTDAWYEEGNRIKEQDHITIQTTLRSNEVQVQEWFSFNPECEGNYVDFWLFKYVGDHTGIKKFTKTVDIKGREITLKYTSIHTTLDDNPYCPDERAAIYEDLRQKDPYYYLVYRYGQWGNRKVENQFAHQFNKDIHLAPVQFNPERRLFISVDFNLSPFGVLFFHDWDDKEGAHTHYFDELTIPNANIDKVCDYIISKYAGHLPNCGLTGDSMGKKKELGQRDNSSYYMQMKKRLNLSTFQMNLPHNPTHQNSRADFNYLLVHHPDWKVNPDKCPNFVRDLMFVECDAYGKIIKSDRKNEAQRADHLDCFTGDTMVSTDTGYKRIDYIQINDIVETPFGMSVVTDHWESESEVYEYTFSDGSKVCCTKDHKFYTHTQGWVEIFRIFDENIQVWKKASDTTARPTQNIQNKNITIHQERQIIIQDHCIDRFGLTTTGKYQKTITFITKTVTLLITQLKTLNLYINANTLRCTRFKMLKTIQNVLRDFPRKAESMLKNGMDQKKELNGTRNMLRILGLANLSMVPVNVKCAGVNLTERQPYIPFALITANQNTGELLDQTMKLESVTNAEVSSWLINTIRKDSVHVHADRHQILTVVKERRIGIEKVYDITVKGYSCFYANDILVHNCGRYSVNTYRKKWIKDHMVKMQYKLKK